MKILYLVVMATIFHIPALPAQETEKTPPVPAATMDCLQAITVFQDVSHVGRKDRAANNITRRHEEMTQDGWRFVDMEVYSENGDLEGFYLTYTRATACPGDASGED